MTIEIHEPELEALILQRMETGRFHSIEEVLLTALKSFPADADKPSAIPVKQNFPDFLLNSRLHGSSLLLERARDLPRAVDL